MTKNNLNLGSTAFIALTSAYFAIALNIKFWQVACEKIDINSFSVLFFALSLPFFIYVPLFWFFSLLVVPRIGKPLIMLLMALSAASDYALQNLGVVINSDMIRNIAETTPREAADLITLHAAFYILIVGILPAVLVYRTHIEFASFGKEIRRRLLLFMLGLSVVGAIAAVSYKEYASFGRNNKQVRYYINTFNYIYAVGRYYKRTADAKREFVILDKSPQTIPTQDGKPRVIVLILSLIHI